jgi:positive regulator of sigma E activity
MTDSGMVISTDESFAEVEVSCLEGCQGCAARSLCVGNKQNKGRLFAKNPLLAKPGDGVRIEIPEARYSPALILLFGGLLTAIITGLGIGYLTAILFSFPLLLACLAGLAIGLVLGGLILSSIFRRKNEEQLYPVIIEILKKGERYGPS